MRVLFATAPGHGDDLDSARSPLLSLPCLLAIAVAIVVVDTRLGARLALITAGFAALSLATRLPRVLAIATVLCLSVAGIALLTDPGSVSLIATHAVVHSARRK